MCCVLIVDDDPAITRLLKITMKSAGHTVATAENGRNALRLMPIVQPDVVLLDLAMPVMDGSTFLKEARKRGYDPNVVVLSASTRSSTRADLAVNAVITKPFDIDDVVDKVEELAS